MEKDYSIRIDHMLDAMDGIEAVFATDPETIPEDWVRRSAVERGFEIVSEASRHIPDEAKAQEPDIPWRQVADIGNIIRHDYSSVRSWELLRIYRDDLPRLRGALQRMKARLT